jgi:hypothetical protein
MKSEAAPIPFPLEEAGPFAQWLATDERIYKYIPAIRAIEGPYREPKNEDDLFESHEAVFTITIEMPDGQLVKTEWSLSKPETDDSNEDITIYFSVPVPVALTHHTEDLVTDFDAWSKQQGISLSPTNLGEDQEPWGAFNEDNSAEIEFQTEYYGAPIPSDYFYEYLLQAVSSIQTVAPASYAYFDWYQKDVIPTIGQQKGQLLKERLKQTSWLSQLVRNHPEATIKERVWELKGVLEKPQTESIYTVWKTPIGEVLLRLNASYREEITRNPYRVDIGFSNGNPAFLKTASEFTDTELNTLMYVAMYKLNQRDGHETYAKFPQLPGEQVYWEVSREKLLYPWDGEVFVFGDEIYVLDENEPLTPKRVNRIIQTLLSQTEAWYYFLDIVQNYTAEAKKIVSEDEE